MRRCLVGLFAASLLPAFASERPPWLDEPRTVTTLDVEAAFRADRSPEQQRTRRVPSGGLHLKLCARSEGARGSESYRHRVSASLEKTSETSVGCVTYPVEFAGREGAYPEYHLILPRHQRRIPARKIYLLSDDFRWFLYLAGSSPGDVFEHHDAEVLRIELWDSSEAGNAPLSIGFSTKCRGHLSDHDSDCYDCETWKNQGRKLEDLWVMHDSVFRCIREKLLDSGPRIIRWSENNSQCFIDYSACVK